VVMNNELKIDIVEKYLKERGIFTRRYSVN
jgi:hypothetical protein